MLGRLGLLIVRIGWTSKVHTDFCFLHYWICSIPNMALNGNPLKCAITLPGRKQRSTVPGIPRWWASSTMMPMSSGIHSISENQSFIWRLIRRLTFKEILSLFLFLFLRRNFLNCPYQLATISWTHSEKFVLHFLALYLNCGNSEFGTSSSDHPVTIYPSCHITFKNLLHGRWD